MIATSLRSPGVSFEVVKPTAGIDTLRTDIAGFIGPTVRGPVSHLTRVDGWRDFMDQFGGEACDFHLPTCVRGYFKNGGQTAYVIRTLADLQSARAIWKINSTERNEWFPSTPAAGSFDCSEYQVIATSPGEWANDLRVSIDYLRRGFGGLPQLKITVTPVDGPSEILTLVSPKHLQQDVAEKSRYIRILDPEVKILPAATIHQGPLRLNWETIQLRDGQQKPASLAQYFSDMDALLDEPEVALIVIPDLHALKESHRLVGYAAARANATLDRQLIVPLPDQQSVDESLQWVSLRRQELDDAARCVTAYLPWLEVRNPLGGTMKPLRRIPPVGHVAGVISRLDRERGAHHTPANAELYEAADTERSYLAHELGQLVNNGLNPVRCRKGRGLEIWGGRTLSDPDSQPAGAYLAHRRLIHRLVRAIRRVSAPLVFDTHAPQLWLVLVRAITTILLEAYRGGALKGERPEEAFRVTCDESNNPPHRQDTGQVLCEIQLAPATPMEFITLRISVSSDGRLELIDA